MSNIFLQVLSPENLTSLISIKEITISGLLIFAIYMLYQKYIESQKKIDALNDKADVIRDKYSDELKAMRTESTTILIKVAQLFEDVLDATKNMNETLKQLRNEKK